VVLYIHRQHLEGDDVGDFIDNIAGFIYIMLGLMIGGPVVVKIVGNSY